MSENACGNSRVRLSIVIPNGRGLPEKLLLQLFGQCIDGDEILVVRNLPSAAWTFSEPNAKHRPSPDELIPEVSQRVAGMTAAARASNTDLKLLESPAGAASARNVGWRHAANELILFIDDDVTLSHSFLTDVREAAVEDRDIGVMTFRVRSRGTGNDAGLREVVDLDRGSVSLRSNRSVALPLREMWRFGAGAAMLARRETLSEIDGFKAELGAGRKNGGAEDLEFLWHATHHTCIAYRANVVVYHGIDGSPHVTQRKSVHYGRAIGALAGTTRRFDGTRMAANYCAYLVRGGMVTRDASRQRRGLLVTQVWIVVAIVETIRVYVLALLLNRRSLVLCPECR